MAISCMHNTSGHNYRNSSFIVVMALGHIYHVPFLVWVTFPEMSGDSYEMWIMWNSDGEIPNHISLSILKSFSK